MDWTKQISYRVHEAGSTVVKEVFVPTDGRTKAQVDAAILHAFQSPGPIASLLREDRSRVDSDLSVVFLAHGSVLEVYFANKVLPLPPALPPYPPLFSFPFPDFPYYHILIHN